MKGTERKFNKKRILIIAVAVLLLVSAVFAFFHLFSGGVKGTGAPLPQGYSISLTPPTDGSKPESHTALENIGYMVGRLSAREYYHTESKSTAKASIMGVTQSVVGSKDYKDGILIVSTVSTSNSSFAPSKALQRFYGEDKVVIRTAASGDKDDWNGLETEWSTGAPAEILDKSVHTSKYGLWATEFSDYVVTESTLLSTDAVPVQEGNEYVLTVALSVSADAEAGRKDATEYYKRQMLTMGDLDDYPSFSSVEMTFRFTEDWTLLTLEVKESYSSKKLITANVEGTNTVTFSYDENAVDVSAYDSYFCKYADAAATGPEEAELSAFDYLTNGFASVLTQEKTAFAVDGTVNGKAISGKALVRMQDGALKGVQAKLGGLDVLYENEQVYLRYKDFFGKVALADLSGLLPEGTISIGLDMAALEQAVSAGTFLKTETGATLSFGLVLGELNVPLTFEFAKEGDSIHWKSISTTLEMMGIEAKLIVTPSEEADSFPVLDTSKATDLYPVIGNIISLVEGRNFELNVAYTGNGISAEGTLWLDVSDGLRVSGVVNAVVQGKVIPAEFTLEGDNLWLSVYDIKVKATLSELKGCLEELSSLLPEDVLPQLDLPQADVSLAEVIETVLDLDFDGIFRTLKLTESGLVLSVDADVLLDGLKPLIGEIGVRPGVVDAEYSVEENSFSLSVMGLSLRIAGSEKQIAEPEDAAEYVPLMKFAEIAETAVNIVRSEDIAFTLYGETTVQEVPMFVEAEGRIGFGDGLRIALSVLINDRHAVDIVYIDGTLQFAYNGYKMVVAENEWKTVADSFSSLFASEKDGTEMLAEPMLLFGTDGFDLFAFIESVKLAVSQDGALQIAMDLSKVLDGAALQGLSLLVKDGGLKVAADSLEMYGLAFEGLSLAMQTGSGDWLVAERLQKALQCSNVFEFLLNSYSGLTETNDLSLDIVYTSAELTALVGGRIRFVQATDSAQVTLDLQFNAEILTPSGNHYMELAIVQDMVYAGYSTIGFEGGVPLRVKLPVYSLFDAGETVLPLLAPLLGIGSDTYYFAFVNKILGGYYETINGSIFGVMNTEEWCNLILGIIDEYAGKDVGAGVSEGTQVAADASGTGLVVESDGLKISLAALRDAEAITAPADADSYMDVSTIAQLLQDVLFAYNYKDFGYHLSGNIKMQVLGIELDLNIGLDVYIGVDEDGSVYLNVQITTGGYSNGLASILIGTSVIIKGDTVTDLTIQNGNLYMSRIQTTYFKSGWLGLGGSFTALSTPYYAYRAMTLEYFMQTKNLMEQLFFAVNMSDEMSGYIKEKAGMDGTEQMPAENTNDAGQMLTSYSANAEGYSLGLNIGAIAKNDTLGALNLQISRERRADGYYDLKELSGSMVLVEADILGKVVSLDFEITNATGEDFRAEYGDLSPIEFAKQVESGERVPHSAARDLVAEKVKAICAVFGYSDAAQLCEAVSAQGYMGFAA